MKKHYLIIAGVIGLLVLVAVGGILLSRSGSAPSEPRILNSPPVSVEGRVIRINHPDGACLTYQIGENVYVSVECPGMAGYEGFVGDYDEDIKVGDSVTVKGNPKTVHGGSDHQVYHLADPGTYMRRAR